MSMTLDQFQLYSAAASDLYRAQFRQDVISAAAGARYDEKSFSSLLKSLE
jgi:hypothetical protein